MAFIIAEAGSAHGGSLSTALELVRMAKQVGADAVKFQYWSDSVALARQRQSPQLASRYSPFQVPFEWLKALSDQAATIGIGFMCTAYLPEDVRVVEPYVQHFKVSSFEAGFVPLLEQYCGLASPERKLFVSLGMGQSVDVVASLLDPRDLNRTVVPMHCVSGYPTPLSQLSLGQIRALAASHFEDCGWSDHADPSDPYRLFVGGLAVAIGASAIEAHLRLDSTSPLNPDYPHAMAPAEFTQYVSFTREAEAMVGWSGVVKPVEESSVAYLSKVVAREAEEKPEV